MWAFGCVLYEMLTGQRVIWRIDVVGLHGGSYSIVSRTGPSCRPRQRVRSVRYSTAVCRKIATRRSARSRRRATHARRHVGGGTGGCRTARPSRRGAPSPCAPRCSRPQCWAASWCGSRAHAPRPHRCRRCASKSFHRRRRPHQRRDDDVHPGDFSRWSGGSRGRATRHESGSGGPFIVRDIDELLPRRVEGALKCATRSSHRMANGFALLRWTARAHKDSGGWRDTVR